jgi:hypothetical protein
MRWLDVVVRTKWARGRPTGRTEEMWLKRVSVVVLDERGMHIVGGEAQPAKVVTRMFVMVILDVAPKKGCAGPQFLEMMRM